MVTVAFNCAAQLRCALPAVGDQLEPGDELIVVDNASADGSAEVAAQTLPSARVIELEQNLGFAAAANTGAEAARGELLLFLNPDAVPQEGFRQAIARPLGNGRGWSAWMGLVTAEGGRVLNSRGGVVHFTGVAWAGGAGEPLPERIESAEVGFASGACLAVPADVWRRLGGFPEDYFLYHEDVELSLRLRLAGERVGIEPGAVVDHDYEFARTPTKLRLLERNRVATVLRTYPAALLVLVVPALLAAELALIASSIAGGWWRLKLGAMREAAGRLPRTLAERRRLQAARVVGAAEFASHLSADLDSRYLGRAAGSRLLRSCLRAYWGLVRRLLALAG